MSYRVWVFRFESGLMAAWREQEKRYHRERAKRYRRMLVLERIHFGELIAVQRVSPILRDLERDGYITVTPVVFERAPGNYLLRFVTYVPPWLRTKAEPKSSKRKIEL